MSLNCLSVSSHPGVWSYPTAAVVRGALRFRTWLGRRRKGLLQASMTCVGPCDEDNTHHTDRVGCWMLRGMQEIYPVLIDCRNLERQGLDDVYQVGLHHCSSEIGILTWRSVCSRDTAFSIAHISRIHEISVPVFGNPSLLRADGRSRPIFVLYVKTISCPYAHQSLFYGTRLKSESAIQGKGVSIL